MIRCPGEDYDDTSINGVIDAETDEEETGADWDFGADLEDTGGVTDADEDGDDD